jgi:hypothetical protein
MRALALIAILSFALTPQIAQAQAIGDFNAIASGQSVYLQWTSSSETEALEYRIQRSFDGIRFHDIHSIALQGSRHTYYYTDSDLFKSAQQTYYYRIAIVKRDSSFLYSVTQEVSLSFSGIRRTWGSIKAMFR